MTGPPRSKPSIGLDHEPITPPGSRDALQELWLPLDVLRWAPTWLTTKPRRATHPRTIILLPGFGAGPRSMRLMESSLRRAGHRVRDWGLGQNTGDAKQLRMRLVAGAWAASLRASTRASTRTTFAKSSRSAVR